MTDLHQTTIVERLRAWAADSVGCNPANAPCAEAAAEIERLRAELLRVSVNALRGDSSPYTLLMGCRMIAEKALTHGR